eukprot:TRINITY_DN5209_c0_g2_i2.p1 TRINITY_DN5209_c0_g2~~TRINITY_DN5209_c0_g2_i2.p1  ORF type:complete len:284 (+),score=27.83 TRINITY_DN5209_c0_g2_i2:218-1069(+)
MQEMALAAGEVKNYGLLKLLSRCNFVYWENTKYYDDVALAIILSHISRNFLMDFNAYVVIGNNFSLFNIIKECDPFFLKLILPKLRLEDRLTLHPDKECNIAITTFHFANSVPKYALLMENMPVECVSLCFLSYRSTMNIVESYSMKAQMSLARTMLDLDQERTRCCKESLDRTLIKPWTKSNIALMRVIMDYCQENDLPWNNVLTVSKAVAVMGLKIYEKMIPLNVARAFYCFEYSNDVIMTEDCCYSIAEWEGNTTSALSQSSGTVVEAVCKEFKQYCYCY